MKLFNIKTVKCRPARVFCDLCKRALDNKKMYLRRCKCGQRYTRCVDCGGMEGVLASIEACISRKHNQVQVFRKWEKP